LRREGSPVGLSAWDASDIFFQIGNGAAGIPGASARTLVLLYASDLAFRLRWEIRPALEDGTTVIAAPYLETIIGFGIAAGLPLDWLESVFSFAPAPQRCYRAPEMNCQPLPRSADSFVEFSLAQLRAAPGVWDTESIRRGAAAHLHKLDAWRKEA
jgi:hypothetical protein